MSWYSECTLENNNGNYIAVIYLNPQSSEFSREFFLNIKKNILTFDEQIRKIIIEKFPNIKVNSAKIMLGTIMIANIPFVTAGKVEASDVSGTAQASQPFYVTKLSTTGVVTASRLNVRTGPSTGYGIIHLLWYGNKVKVIGESGEWIQIQLTDGRTGWVNRNYLKLAQEPTMVQQKIDLVLNTAFHQIGTPYLWGGNSPEDGGFDCSGLTQYVFEQAGYNLPRISRDQAVQGINVLRDDIQPGDLVFFSIDQNGVISHVGIYTGNGKMIHSPKAGDVVKLTDITTAYWQSRVVTIRRIIR